MQQTVSSTRTCSEFVQEHVVPCLLSALLKRQIYEMVHLSQGGLTEGFLCHFLISFNRVHLFYFIFFPHWQLCECEYATVWEKVGLEKAHLSFTGNYWLGLELRNKISHGNQSHFGLCHIFHSVQLFPFAAPFSFFFHSGSHSLRQTSPQGGETGGMHTSNPQTEIEPLQWIFGNLFYKERPIIKGNSQRERLEGLFKSLKWLKLWFPTGIYYHVLLTLCHHRQPWGSVCACVCGGETEGVKCQFWGNCLFYVMR